MKYTVTSIQLDMSNEQQVHVKMTIKYLSFFLFTYNITQSLTNHKCTLYHRSNPVNVAQPGERPAQYTLIEDKLYSDTHLKRTIKIIKEREG